MDDAQLIRRYADDGSEEAFSELVRRHVNLVHSAAMRQVGGDFHRAEDVTQKVFILLARKARSLARHTALTGWLYATTHYEASTLMRSERRRNVREEETYRMNELLASQEPTVDWDRLRPVLDGAMLELNEHDREAILGRFFDALPLAALGEKLGVSETAARKRVDRALDKMRVSLGKRGANSTTAALALMLADHSVVAAPEGLAESVTSRVLASAAGAGSQASWFLKILGRGKLATGISGVVWMGGILGIPVIGAAAYEFWSARHATAALAQEDKDYAAQQARFRTLRRTVKGAHLAATRLEKSAAAPRDPKADFQNFLRTYPQARAILIAGHKGLVMETFGSFFRSARLTPLQIEEFEDAVAEAWLSSMTITPDKIAMVGTTPMPTEDQMRAILGEPTTRQFQEYDRTASAHYWAYQVAGYSAASFSADQLDRLATIFATNTTAPQSGDAFGSPSLVSIDWDAVETQAKALFSDDQWKAAEPILIALQAKGAAAGAPPSATAAGSEQSTSP